MTRHKRKILIIIIFSVLLVLAAGMVTIAFANNYIVNYNYDVTAHSSMLTAGYDGANFSIQRSSGTGLTATKADMIVISTDNDLKLSQTLNSVNVDYDAVKTVAFTHNMSAYYKMVFKGLVLTGDSTTIRQSGGAVSAVGAPMTEARYIESGGATKTVTYDNAYVSSMQDLRLIDFQTNYNDVFELWDNYFAKKVVARTIYIMDSFTVSENYQLNIPCSINLLSNVITLDAELKLLHSYAGAYYITAETNTYEGAGGLTGSGSIKIKAPKAYYSADFTAHPSFTGRLITESYSTDYLGYIKDDALAFAKNLIPKKTYGDVMLQPVYQTFGISYSYYIIESDASLTPFYGVVTTDARSGCLRRNPSDTTYNLRIYADIEGVPRSNNFIDTQIKVIGTGESEMLENLLGNITDHLYTEIGNVLALNINLLPLFKEVYTAGGFAADSAITLTVSESQSLPVTDVNAAKISINGISALTYTVYYDGVSKLMCGSSAVDSFILRQGMVTISEKLTIKLTSVAGSGLATTDFTLREPSNESVLYFLRSSAPIFTTNKVYDLINLNGGALYLGTGTLLTHADLGVTGITYTTKVKDSNGDYINPAEPLAYYFDITDGGKTLTFKDGVSFIEKDMYLQYTVTFSDNSTENINILIRKTMADDGGESQSFESSNPFDELFMNTDTVWVEGGTFNVPESDPNHYAKIEILSVNGYDYKGLGATAAADGMYHDVCSIENTGSLSDSPPTRVDHNGDQYYKTVKFVTNRDYVPMVNTYVRVRCYYLINTQFKTDIVLTQDYTVTIPGIYKCYDPLKTNPKFTPYVFEDKAFYNLTVETIYNYFEPNARPYVSLLSDETTLVLLANSSNASLPLNYSSLAPAYTGTRMKTLGLEKLKKVTAITLDGITIDSLAGFADMSDSDLKYLSMNGCGVTDTALYSTYNQSYIFDIQMTYVDLSNNHISRTANLVARTVQTLKLAGQRTAGTTVACLSSIDGLSNVVDLVDLDISNNAIYNFELLKSFEFLRTVFLYGNRLSDTVVSSLSVTTTLQNIYTMYGTDGLVNMPFYVELIKNKGIAIYAAAGNLSETGKLAVSVSSSDPIQKLSAGGKIPMLIDEGASALNGFASPTKLFSATGRTQLVNDLAALIVRVDSSGGISAGGTSIYTFRADWNGPTGTLPTTTPTLRLMNDNRQVVTISGSVTSPVKCRYIVTAIKAGSIIAIREFVIYVCY